MHQQTEVLPSELQLVAPPTIPQARSYLFKQQSELQEYDVAKGNRIRINIPRLQRSYLMKDSYLRFRLNLDMVVEEANQSLYLDRCGAHGLFDRIEVYDYLGGTLLEQTSNIPALVTLLGDLNNTYTEFNSKKQAVEGFDGSNIQQLSTELEKYEIRTANSGMLLFQHGNTAPSGNPELNKRFRTVEFCLPIMSFLGTFSDKYIPLHNGFSIDFFLNSRDLAFVSRLGPQVADAYPIKITDCWISQFEYCCQIMELGEQAESMVASTDPFVIPATQYRYFSDVILGSGSQSNFRLDLNLNVVSLRNIRFGMRPSVYQSLQYPSYGHRIRNFLDNFTFQYGSSYLPEIAGVTCRSLTVPYSKNNATISNDEKDAFKADGFTQAYRELYKTVDSRLEGTINRTEYRIDTNTQNYLTDISDYRGMLVNDDVNEILANIPYSGVGYTNGGGSICGKFAAGLDTRLSMKETISGIDTNGLLVSVNGSFDRDNVEFMAQALLDCWAEHDAFIQIIPGVATTVTF